MTNNTSDQVGAYEVGEEIRTAANDPAQQADAPLVLGDAIDDVPEDQVVGQNDGVVGDSDAMTGGSTTDPDFDDTAARNVDRATRHGEDADNAPDLGTLSNTDGDKT